LSNKDKRRANQYLKYSGITFQLFFFLLVAAYGGKYLDEYMGNGKPYMTLILVLLAVIGFFYKVYKDLAADDGK
jgi:hypothetical protein